MRKKVGTILDEELIFQAKKIALAQRVSLNQVLENALKSYLPAADKKLSKGKKNIAQATHGIMKISPVLLKAIMEEEDLYEAG